MRVAADLLVRIGSNMALVGLLLERFVGGLGVLSIVAAALVGEVVLFEKPLLSFIG